MSRLVMASRYLKSGTPKQQSKRKNYTKYIATRETVEIRENNNSNAPATKSQQELIASLVQEFPDTTYYLEYTDYKETSNQANASEFISSVVERNADIIGNRKNFVGYMAMRPGVEKRGSHGLFSMTDEPIVLDRVANEIANHPGIIWSHVLSLRRCDAARLGYDDSERWRDLVKRHINDIAQQSKISLSNLRWYAAFHNTTHHPHIHLIVYSTNPHEGYLTKEGISKIRSAFAKDIFHDELGEIYQAQTLTRDQLKSEVADEMSKLTQTYPSELVRSKSLQDNISLLYTQLDNFKGKKVYGYLRPEIKATVDNIFIELSNQKNIKALYEKWCELESDKYRTYTLQDKEFPLLHENKEFRSVKNTIINIVGNMMQPSVPDILVPDIEPDNMESSEETAEENKDDFTSEDYVTADRYVIDWSDNYKQACRIMYDKKSEQKDFLSAEKLLITEAERRNVLALHDLGKLYSTDKLGNADDDKSMKYYSKALQGFLNLEPQSSKLQSYIQYRTGKMYCYGLGTEQDYEKAFNWFNKSACAGNKYAQFSLGNMYYYGNGTDKDLSQAFLWYGKSLSQGQPYASYSVAQMYNKGEHVEKDIDTAQLYYKTALSGFLNLESKGQADDNLLYKVGTMYKKGLGTETDTAKANEYFRQSAELNNKNALYEYGKVLIQDSTTSKKGLEYLEKSVSLGNTNAKRFVAGEYISGEHIEQDIDKGMLYLTEASDSGDKLSSYKLGKIYLDGKVVIENLALAEKYLLLADDNSFTQYALGKLYLQKEKYDIDKAISYLESASSESDWASYLLGKLYCFGTIGLEKDKEKAHEWLSLSAEQGNIYAEYLIQNIDNYENTVFTNTILGLFTSLASCISDGYNRNQNSYNRSVDRKLKRMINWKKQELGIKQETIIDI